MPKNGIDGTSFVGNVGGESSPAGHSSAGEGSMDGGGDGERDELSVRSCTGGGRGEWSNVGDEITGLWVVLCIGPDVEISRRSSVLRECTHVASTESRARTLVEKWYPQASYRCMGCSGESVLPPDT